MQKRSLYFGGGFKLNLKLKVSIKSLDYLNCFNSPLRESLLTKSNGKSSKLPHETYLGTKRPVTWPSCGILLPKKKKNWQNEHMFIKLYLFFRIFFCTLFWCQNVICDSNWRIFGNILYEFPLFVNNNSPRGLNETIEKVHGFNWKILKSRI